MISVIRYVDMVAPRPGPADQHGDRPRVPGEMDGGLAGRVAAADHHHVPALHRTGLGAGGSVEDPGADQGLQGRNVEPAPRDTRGQHHRPGPHRAAIGRVHDPVRTPHVDRVARWVSTKSTPKSQACSLARTPRSWPLIP